MTDDELRAIARATGREMDKRMAPMTERLDEIQAALDEQNERLLAAEKLLGIKHHELHNVAYDGLASGDQGAVWDDFEFDQSVPARLVPKLTDGYGR